MSLTTTSRHRSTADPGAPFAAAKDLGRAGGATNGRRERRLLPVVLAYAPVPVAGALLSIAWNVGATPTSGAADLPLRGTALAPPLFLPLALLGAAAAARRPGAIGMAGVAVCALVGAAFLGGSTLNVPNDLAAGQAAGTPAALTIALAIVHCALAITLLWHALPALIARFGR